MSFWDDAKKIGGDIVDGAQEMASDAVDAVGGALEDGAQAGEDAYNWAKDQVESGAQAAEELFTSGVARAEEAVQWSRNAYADAVDWTETTASDAYEAGSEMVGNTVDFAIDAGSSAGGWASNAISDGYDFVSDTASDIFDFGLGMGEDVLDFGSDAVDWTGQALEDAGEYIWNRSGAALYGLADGAWQITEGAWLDLTEGVGRFTRGFKNAERGDWGQAFEDWGVGIVKTVVQTPADAFLMGAGRASAAAQTIIGLEPEGRELNATEIAELKTVFGDSIDYDKIIIKRGDSFLKGLGGRPFTEGNVIYLPDSYNFAMDPGTLVHEAVHVWQHQNGGNDYMSESLWEQNFGEGYDWKQKFDAGILAWEALNPEQQAKFIEDAYNRGYFNQPDGTAGVDRSATYATQFVTREHGTFLEQCLALMRNGEGAA